MPIFAKSTLKTPNAGLTMNENISPTATSDIVTGMKKTMRKNPGRYTRPELRKIASAGASTSTTKSVPIVHLTVPPKACQNCASPQRSR